MSTNNNANLIEEFIHSSLYNIKPNGEIWTLRTKNGVISKDKEWRKMGTMNNSGYLVAKFKNRPLLLHRIVFRKFGGRLDGSLVINHINGDKLDNKIENLEQVSHQENMLHSYRVLKNQPVIGNKKITLEIARTIREDRMSGYKYDELIDKYNVSKTTISYIINNKIWKEN